MKNVVKRWLNKFGYTISRYEEPEFTLVNDAGTFLEEQYHQLKNGKPLHCSLPIATGRGYNFFGFSEQAHPHPLFVAAVLLLNNDRESAWQALSLAREEYAYYNPLEALGFDGDIEPDYEYPNSLFRAHPWQSDPIDRIYQRICSAVQSENRHYGLKQLDFFGNPELSDRKIEVELQRLEALIDSVQSRGYIPDLVEPVICDVLLDGEQWCWLLRSGEHRVSVLAAMNIEHVGVRVNKIVRRNEANVWPQVMSGVYSETLAVSYFDHLMQLDAPRRSQKWLSFVQTALNC